MFEGMVDRALSRTQPESALVEGKPMAFKAAASASGFDPSTLGIGSKV
jgi:hypothetical protein